MRKTHLALPSFSHSQALISLLPSLFLPFFTHKITLLSLTHRSSSCRCSCGLVVLEKKKKKPKKKKKKSNAGEEEKTYIYIKKGNTITSHDHDITKWSFVIFFLKLGHLQVRFWAFKIDFLCNYSIE